MSFIYPTSHPSGEITREELHLLLSDPNAVLRRVLELSKDRFLADFLLTGRYKAQNGGIYFETGEGLYTNTPAEPIAPGAEYGLTTLTNGKVIAARTVKWGQGVIVTDEKLSREGLQHLNNCLTRVSNTIVKQVDEAALAVIEASITSTSQARQQWANAGSVLEHLATIKGERAELDRGIDLNTVVMSTTAHAKLLQLLVDGRAINGDTANSLLAGQIPTTLFGFEFVASPRIKTGDIYLFDRNLLGGMADENIQSPEFSTGNYGIETSATRLPERDAYLLRGRRTTVPVVLEPLAGVKLTNTGV